MGSNSFFSMLANHDPLAQALHLPGAGKYAQSQARGNIAPGTGPYAGQPATLAGANAGYVGNAPGANSGMGLPANPYAAAAGQRPAGIAPPQQVSWQQGQISPMQSR
jgi:hypothetical protein